MAASSESAVPGAWMIRMPFSLASCWTRVTSEAVNGVRLARTVALTPCATTTRCERRPLTIGTGKAPVFAESRCATRGCG